ncbi:Universal stress protein (Usp) [Roseibacterium elongatum DSM 19469]|uniref:Universal stress protein (Usp) n=1 Tax=Roseicyclus elongatus DSM 19469 TaxID=1294273 RepID=W8S8X6_9RHOB|nr:universal stress protein [Roseibacterium elongatum]AHM05401.1 Universal stress protein (Usp) [Roseibacterium elongatum DSM 19469]
MFKHIMVPVDLGHAEKLDRALAVAADMARHYEARVTYVGVTTPQPSSVAHTPEEFAEKLAHFAAAQAEVRGIADVASDPITSHDPAVDLDKQLVKAGEDLCADLIIMGSHIPKRFDLGSHGGHLASLSHHSVMIVRDDD